MPSPAVIGSANLNDRSMHGDRDSELAALFTGGETIRSRMGGTEWEATLFAHTLRRSLMEEHVGLPLTCDGGVSVGAPSSSSGVAFDTSVSSPAAQQSTGVAASSPESNVSHTSTTAVAAAPISNAIAPAATTKSVSNAVGVSSEDGTNGSASTRDTHRSKEEAAAVQFAPPLIASSTRVAAPPPATQAAATPTPTAPATQVTVSTATTTATQAATPTPDDTSSQHEQLISALQTAAESVRTHTARVARQAANGLSPQLHAGADDAAVLSPAPASSSTLQRHAEPHSCVRAALLDPILAYDGFWLPLARSNTAIFDHVFPSIMKDSITSLSEWKLADKEEPRHIAELLPYVSGHLVLWPKRFLEHESLETKLMEKENYFPSKLTQ